MGATYLCYQLKVLGVDVTGGMQEYWAVPAARLLKASGLGQRPRCAAHRAARRGHA